MSKPIKVKFDNTLEDIEVIKPLYPTSSEEGGSQDLPISEIKITGTFTPLVKFNNKVLPWDSILEMTLECKEFLPTLSLTFMDACSGTMLLDTPGPDNEVILEILPRFDKIYKKIKLKFYVVNIHSDIVTNEISIRGIYNCKGLNDCNIESFGKITTYKFYEQAAQRLKLGLCSNIDDSDDESWIYMNSNTWKEVLESELRDGGTPECVLDGWIDWWNNINIVDIKDLYLGDPDNKIQVYVLPNFINTDIRNEEEPLLADAIITNDYRLKSNPLYTPTFRTLSTNDKNKIKGTDKAINIYNINDSINQSLMIQDGSGVKNDNYIKYYYRGEYNADDNNGSYLFQEEVSSTLKQKISNNVISVTLSQPCLGLMRGGHVNFEWYDSSNYNTELYKKGKDINSNIPLEPNTEENFSDDSLIGTQYLNRKISGQYLIIGSTIRYRREMTIGGPTCNMTQEFILARPVQTFNYSDLTEKDK